MYDREKILFIHEVESKVNGLNFQRERVLDVQAKEKFNKKISPVHDVDFYLIILRRIYRCIEKIAIHDSRVANLKGKNQDLFTKIKIRDHFEHGVDVTNMLPTQISDLPRGTISGPEGSNVKIATSLLNNVVVSEGFQWDLSIDHDAFLVVVEEFVNLYPFS